MLTENNTTFASLIYSKRCKKLHLFCCKQQTFFCLKTFQIRQKSQLMSPVWWMQLLSWHILLPSCRLLDVARLNRLYVLTTSHSAAIQTTFPLAPFFLGRILARRSKTLNSPKEWDEPSRAPKIKNTPILLSPKERLESTFLDIKRGTNISTNVLFYTAANQDTHRRNFLSTARVQTSQFRMLLNRKDLKRFGSLEVCKSISCLFTYIAFLFT